MREHSLECTFILLSYSPTQVMQIQAEFRQVRKDQRSHSSVREQSRSSAIVTT